MANEAVIVELSGIRPIYFSVSDANAIEKGVLLKLIDIRGAVATSGSGEAFAGITAAEKVASDGSTKLALHVPGNQNVFDLYAAGPITVGQYVCMSGANMIRAATEAEIAAGAAVGKALETTTGDEVIQVLV